MKGPLRSTRSEYAPAIVRSRPGGVRSCWLCGRIPGFRAMQKIDTIRLWHPANSGSRAPHSSQKMIHEPSSREVVMKAWSKFVLVAMAGCVSALIAGAPANAGEITVVAGAGPLPDVMGTLLPMFESATGNKVKISFKGGPAITADVKQGAADLAVTNTELVDQLAASGDVAGDGKTLLMISKVGVAVKA